MPMVSPKKQEQCRANVIQDMCEMSVHNVHSVIITDANTYYKGKYAALPSEKIIITHVINKNNDSFYFWLNGSTIKPLALYDNGDDF